MSKITVGFSKPKTWKPFAWLIMAGYGIPYDHVYIQFYSEKYSRFMIYQASKSLVNFMGQEIFKAENLIVDEFAVEITDDNRTKMIQFAIDNAGRAYGAKQALGMAIVRVFEIFGKYIENPFKDGGNTYVCSELGAYILREFAGAVLPTDLDDITPKDLYEYMSKVKTAAGV